MSKGLDEIDRLLKRMEKGEAAHIAQIKVIRALVMDREIDLMENADSLRDKIDQMGELGERRVQPQRTKRSLSFVRCDGAAPSTRNDMLTDEFRAFLHKERTRPGHHENA